MKSKPSAVLSKPAKNRKAPAFQKALTTAIKSKVVEIKANHISNETMHSHLALFR